MTTIHIDGAIGWDVTARDIREQLSGAGDIDLQISSPGGAVDEGLAIINALRDHRRAGHQVTARVVGYAASMATGIALAADRVEVEDNSVWMVHNPLGIEIGDYRAMRKYGDILDSLARVLGKAYSDKTGRGLAATRKEMDDETWLFGQEIIDAGYADAMTPAGDGPESKKEAKAIVSAALHSMTAKLREREQTPLDQIAALLPQPPANSAITNQEPDMAQANQPPVAADPNEPQTDPTTDPATPQADPQASKPASQQADMQAAVQAAISAERSRVAAITARCTQVNMAHLTQALIDNGADLAACNAAIVDEYVAKGGAEIRQTTTQTSADTSAASWDAVVSKINKQRG